MAEFDNFDALFAHVFQLQERGEYAQALDIATREGKRFPENTQFLRYIRAGLASRLNDSALALKLLGEALADGHWYAEERWNDEAFAPLRDHPEFQRLRAISKARLEAAGAKIKPELTTFAPEGDDAESVPFLLALHGNHSSVYWHKDHWRTGANGGWLVALPESSQLAGHDTIGQYVYVWDDENKADEEILGHWAVLDNAHAIDHNRVVLGGFSRGAETVVRLALQGIVQARGFIAVCPGGPYSTVPELWEPVIEAGKGRDLRGYVIVGGQDQYAEGGRKLVEMLRAAGMTVELEEHPEMGHDYPADFRDRLAHLLDYVLGD